MEEESVKILFRFYSDIFEEEKVETMWAKVIDKSKGLYKIDSIPFYAPLIASDDIVFAEYDDTELMLSYRKTVTYSGNSIVWVVMMDKKTAINDIRDLFHNMGCLSEKVNDIYFSMEILEGMDYCQIQKKLKKLEEDEIIGYSEPCLSEKHKLQITDD
jgi:hypothetical protein